MKPEPRPPADPLTKRQVALVTRREQGVSMLAAERNRLRRAAAETQPSIAKHIRLARVRVEGAGLEDQEVDGGPEAEGTLGDPEECAGGGAGVDGHGFGGFPSWESSIERRLRRWWGPRSTERG